MMPRERHEWLIAAAVALLIASIPLTIQLIAAWQTLSATHAAKALGAKNAASISAFYARNDSRRILQQATAPVGVAVVLDHLAAVLPQEAMLVSVERDNFSELTLRIATNDPDRLRTALHRDPLFAKLHDRDQSQSDGVMLVTLSEAP
tara:strand:- start:547 stop:990 length:444 start_codon:yes stop_codon:yes gene_type:complete